MKKSLSQFFQQKRLYAVFKSTNINYNTKLEFLTPEILKNHYQDIKDNLRETHIEQHLIGTFFPFEHHDAYYTIFALNNELTKIKSEDFNASMIRMAWWKENINLAIQGKPANVPVLLCLSDVAKRYELKSLHFRQILKWRETDLRWKQPPSLKSIEEYAEGTYSQILYILLKVLNITDHQAEHAASHIGKAMGICNLLRGTIYHARNRITYLPSDICAKYRVSEEDIYQMKSSKSLEDVVFEIADFAKAHIDHARTLTIPKEANAPLLHSVL
eukprot:gene7845-12318_t